MELPSENDARLVERTMEILGGKWKVLILWHLGVAGVCRLASCAASCRALRNGH